MRFYEIALFIFIVNLVLAMSIELDIFTAKTIPASGLDMRGYNDTININKTSSDFESPNILYQAIDYIGFIFTGAKTIVFILYQTTIGSYGMLKNILGSDSEPIAFALALLQQLIYVLGIIQFFSGRTVE